MAFRGHMKLYELFISLASYVCHYRHPDYLCLTLTPSLSLRAAAAAAACPCPFTVPAPAPARRAAAPHHWRCQPLSASAASLLYLSQPTVD